MAVTDYDREKTADTASYTGSPTIDKAQYIKCVDGDDSSTGTGDIVIDFANISSESDFAVYDADDNLLPYEIETFDTSGNVIEAWVYDGWTADGSTQLKVVYGNGPASSEEDASGTWNNAAQNVRAAWLCDDSSGPLDDSGPNGNDGSVTGTTLGDTGQFGDAVDGDGVDDTIEATDSASLSTSSGGQISCAFWVNVDPGGSDSLDDALQEDDNHAELIIKWDEYGFGYERVAANDYRPSVFTFGDNADGEASSGSAISLNTWYGYLGTIDFTNAITVYQDGTQEADVSTTDDTSDTTNSTFFVGFDVSGEDSDHFDVTMDAVRLYSDIKDADWSQAEYDMSPKAGQVFFTQNAASDAGSSTETDSASLVTASATPLTATETTAATDSPTITTAAASPQTGTETATATDTATISTAAASPQTATETATSTDSATITTAAATVLTSSEFTGTQADAPTLVETRITHRGRVATRITHRGRTATVITSRGRDKTRIEHR